MSSLHISISAEPVFHIGSFVISNSMLTSGLVSALIVLFAVVAGMSLKKSGKIGRLQALSEMIIGGLYDFATEMTGSRKKAALFLPLVLSFFVWITMNNWAGLLPGVGTIGFREGEEVQEEHAQITPWVGSARASTSAEPEVHAEKTDIKTEAVEAINEHEASTEIAESESHEVKGVFVPYFRAGTADLNTTIALAIISVVATQYFGLQALGISYLTKYFNFSSPINAFVGILELILETAKIMSFAFRLFGNIFAGEVLLAVMMFLVPVVVPMPFYGLEIFVGMIQGVVFAMLSLVFFNLATHGHGEEH